MDNECDLVRQRADAGDRVISVVVLVGSGTMTHLWK